MTNENKQKVPAKRKLKALDFTGADAAIALVSKDQGGPANGVPTLLIKSAKQPSKEFLEKASQITVTLSINEYLRRFFGIWDSVDQEILARSLGFTTEGMDEAAQEAAEEALDANEPPEYPDWSSSPGDTEFEKYINYKLQSISVMKSLKEAEDIDIALGNLSEDEYLTLLKDQELVEKCLMGCGDKKPPKPKRVTKQKKEKENMPNVNNELVELQKSLEAQKNELDAAKVELQKSLEIIKQFEQEKKELIEKQRKDSIVEAIGDAAVAEVIFKALKNAEDEDFVAAIKSISEVVQKAKKIEQDLFVEKGVQLETDVQNENPLEAILKAKFNK